MVSTALRLLRAIQAAAPSVTGVSIGTAGVAASVLVEPSSQQAAAQATIDAFNWSAGAHATWENLEERDAAKAVYDLTDRQAKLFRAIALVLLDELNVLRQQVVGVATFVWDPANLADAAGLTRADIAVAGAAFGDVVDVAAPYTLAGITCTAYVHSAGIVGIRLQNESGAAVNLTSGSWTVAVRRHVALPDRTPAQARTAIRNKLDTDA